ncbi:hypothetical protein EDM52_20670 [Brevibacillus invocatus]|uniref:DZANK-type domain-containing protein n=1 Tax=Brevibacillus invocatus TaxID=173959 RepID=A0A3M8BXW2_9BACL|nr:hypothetical protein [Brevibacillus invocatus]RNB68268.1 hypothetical protein EDM52_20670 [Brevibacillus invocatus]
MIYDGFELDSKGRALICPRCSNEQINGGEFCKICGVTIINKCSSSGYDTYKNEPWECGTIAEGNARYCIKCGEKTTFFENELLKAWDVEHQEKIIKNDASDLFSSPQKTVHISDEDLPF